MGSGVQHIRINQGALWRGRKSCVIIRGKSLDGLDQRRVAGSCPDSSPPNTSLPPMCMHVAVRLQIDPSFSNPPR